MTTEQVINLAWQCQQAGQLPQAEKLYRQVLATQPNHPDALHLLGMIAYHSGHHQAAVDLLRRAIAVAPVSAEFQFDLANALRALGQKEQSVTVLRKAIALRPDFLEAHDLLGQVLGALGRPQESAAAFRQAIVIRPDSAEIRNNLGIALLAMGEVDQAIACHRAALALLPDHPLAHWNLGMALLMKGDYERGWPEYEWRRKSPTLAKKLGLYTYDKPVWDGSGQSLAGRRILIHAEQGFGDVFQFVRHIPDVARLGAHIIFACRLELMPLLQARAEQGSCLDSVREWLAPGQIIPDFDVHCALASLPGILKITLANIPAQVPYIWPDAAQREKWNYRLGQGPGLLKVGLVWAGKARPDPARSIDPACLAPLAGVGQTWFISLQKATSDTPAPPPPPELEIKDWTEELNDFADTAGLMAHLDLIITIDTAVAHLAGAMGQTDVDTIKKSAGLAMEVGGKGLPVVPNDAIVSPAENWRLANADGANSQGDSTTGGEARNENFPMTIDDALRLAAQHHQAGRLAEAETLYRQVLAARPNDPDALHLLGKLASQIGRHDVALDLIGRAITASPANADYHLDLGVSLEELGQLTQAAAAFHTAISLKRDFPQAFCNLGNVLRKRGQMQEAVAAFRQALDSRPDYAMAHYNLGCTWVACGKFDAAAASFEQAIALQPNYAKALNNLGGALQKLGQIDKAISAFERAVALRPDQAEGYNNLGNAYCIRGDIDQAIRCCRKSLSLRPNYAEAHNNLGIAHYARGDIKAAIDAYQSALALQPDCADAHCNLGMALLLQGDFDRGWPEYEWRRRVADFGLESHFAQPLWNGEPLGGKRIVLQAEQGFGDTIQLARYVPEVARRGGKVLLVCQAELLSLLRQLEGIEDAVTQIEPGTPFDVHCPLMSLPRVFNTRLDTIPSRVPYLSADRRLSDQWKARLPLDDRPKVGLAWAGKPTHIGDRHRSFPLSLLGPLKDIPGIFYCSLQKGEAAGQTHSAEMSLTDWTEELTNFADTAALIAHLDLVISADTAVAHLAGAMGKRVWVLLPFAPDWRWMLGRSDCSWYPTMRLFRQPRLGDWQTPIAQLVESLRTL